MKISKLLVLAAVLMTMSVSAQKKAAAKPAAAKTAKTASTKATKAETMDWIGGKMQENLAAPRKFVSYANGLFVYSKELNTGKVCVTTIDLNKVTGLSNEYSDDFFLSGKKSAHTKCPGEDYGTDFEYVSVAGPNYNDYSAPFNFTPDQTLVERMRKALTTLVEYNAAGSKKADEKF